MKESYVLVITSVLFSLLLGIFFFLYRFIFPRKKIALLVLFILIGCLPIVSIFRPGSYESGDLSSHIMEGMYFYKALSQGDFFPVWGGEMNATYGYPSFLFLYPLPFYLIAFMHVLGFSFITSTKLVLAIAYLLSGICMYLFLNKEFGKKSAIVGGLVYLFAPYHLIDLHFRVDIGEIVAFIFLPLTLLAVKSYFETKGLRWYLLEIISLSALIISHPAISIAGVPIVLLYSMFFLFRKPPKFSLILSQAVVPFFVLGITSFYWFPLLYDLRFTYHNPVIKNLSFVGINELLYSPWGLGFLFQGQGRIAFLLGYPQIGMLIISMIFLLKRKMKDFDKK